MNKYRAIAYLKRFLPGEKVSDIYDSDEMFRMALDALLPGFEYPDISHLTVAQVLDKG